jgi:serine O-acetyltransferase
VRVVDEIIRDTLAISRALYGATGRREIARTLMHDGMQTLALFRVRKAADRHGIPGVGALLRRVETFVYGVHIERDVELGEGVLFAHTVGIVIGGNARVGDRVMFLGSNTVGSADRTDFPSIGNDVVVGAGARIIGSVRVGDGAAVGANAVVVRDVADGCSAKGVPAVVRERSTDLSRPSR